MIIHADHSGPTYVFDGTVPPGFKEKFLAWMREHTKQEDPDVGPDEFDITKDGSESSVRYEFEEFTVHVTELKDGGLDVHIRGDWEQHEAPDNGFFTEGKYSDDEYDTYLVYKGQAHSPDDLLALLKKTDTAVTQTPTPVP